MLNKPSLKGALVEMVVVVASILIAFGLDAWWDGQQEGREERTILLNLEEEFDSLKASVEEQTLFHQDVKAAVQDLLDFAIGETIPAEPSAMDSLLSYLCWSGGESHYPHEITNSIINTGKLSLIQNEELRHLLAGWPLVIEGLLENERHEREVMHTRWWPYMMEKAYIPQLQKWLDGPGLMEPKVLSTLPNRSEQMDHRVFLRDPVFANILLFRLWSQDDILSNYQEFEPNLEYIIHLIKSEVGTRE
jgi:hypothetical protein